MANWVPISGSALQFSKNAGGAAAADYYLKFYAAGTTTPISMATTSSGVTTLDKCKVDSNGWAVNGSDDPFIPHIDRDYKLVLYTNATDADADSTGSAVWVIDNLSTESLDKQYTSVAALRDSTGNDSFNIIEIESYYEITYPSTAGPKGGHRRHRTGGTNTAPTVGSPVAVSTIGTGTQAGYVWDGDGVEWVLSEDQVIDVHMFGAIPGSDSVTEINNAILFGSAVIIDDYFKFSAPIVLKSNFNLVFEDGGFIEPTSPGIAIQALGSEPSSYVSLSADMNEGDAAFTATTSITGVAVGDWVEIRSEALFPGTNALNGKFAWIGKVIKITGSTYEIDAPVPYDMLTADTAKAGKATMLENISIQNPQINKEDFTTLITIGIQSKYCANLEITNPKIYGSKNPTIIEDEITDAGKNAILIDSCVNASIDNIYAEVIAWYGVGVNGPCRGIRINQGSTIDVRHGVSIVNASDYGEPFDVITTGMTANRCTKSGFDTHDTGQQIFFNDCRSFYSGDSGFQLRSNGVTLTNPVAAYSTFDGVVCRENGFNSRVINPQMYQNQRNGLGFGTYDCDVEGGECKDNAQSGSGANWSGSHGTVKGLKISGSGRAMDLYPPSVTHPLLISGLYNDRGGATGGIFMLGQESGGNPPDFEKVTIENSYMPDYNVSGSGSTMFFTNATMPTNARTPRMIDNILSSDNTKVRGIATLVAGTATVTGLHVVQRSIEPLYNSVVKLRRVGFDSNPGALTGVATANQIVITSTDSSDTSDVEWWVDG